MPPLKKFSPENISATARNSNIDLNSKKFLLQTRYTTPHSKTTVSRISHKNIYKLETINQSKPNIVPLKQQNF